MMVYTVLMVIVAVAVIYLAHVQRRTLEVQSEFICHLVEMVKEDKKESSSPNGDRIREIVSKTRALPS